MSGTAPGDRVTLRKFKYQSGDLWLMWQWEEIIWHCTNNYWVSAEAPGMVLFRKDKSFSVTEYALFYFYPGEPFHFFEIYSGEPPHAFRGWYCNINLKPERTSDGYSYVDLDLDIWLYPDLSYEILDEDEYRENACKFNYPEELRTTVETTCAELRRRIERVEFPFRRDVKTLEAESVFLTRYFNTATPPYGFERISSTA